MDIARIKTSRERERVSLIFYAQIKCLYMAGIFAVWKNSRAPLCILSKPCGIVCLHISYVILYDLPLGGTYNGQSALQ